MEVTVLVQAVYKAFEILEKGKNSEKAREEARELLYTSAKFTSESKSLTEKRAARDLLLSARQPRLELRNSVLTFFILFAFWILLSGRFDTFHLTLGVICSVLVACLSHDLLFFNIRLGDFRTRARRFVQAGPWFLGQIFSANLHVAYLALSPKMPIDPQIIRFKTKLESDIAWVALANSITLTPGTITINISEGEFFVHALDRKVAYDLNTGEMEDKIAHVIMEADHVYIQDVIDVSRIFGALK
ncbi:MAG: Na+/H+ antiporter subunit E [Deltaproteobacteria bacterium]|nr:Na+/H+ antiporter subunit E [Deltaproteobacteria bacterium]MBW2104503.1 Na+/H+ antiporter subunit E [Deltaproteobacteria bacterium]